MAKSEKAQQPRDDAAAAREQAKTDAVAAVEEQHDRAEAMAATPQKVTDGNEAAALETVTGQKPERDVSGAPSPNELGPHIAEDGEDAAAATDPKGDG